MKKIAISSLAVALSAMAADAATIFQENFSYPNGTLTSVSGGNWTNFNGSVLPIQVNNGIVTLTNLSSGTSGEDVARALDAGYSSGTLYFSTLVSVTQAPTGANGDYFMSFRSSAGSGGGFEGRLFLSTTTTGWTFGLATGGSTPTDWTSDLSLNTEYKIVVKLDLTADTTTFGVFGVGYTPTSDSELSVAGGGTNTVTAAIDQFALRQGSASGSAFTTQVNAVWTGTTLADVAAIPEPTSAAMLIGGIGSAIWAFRRRRVVA